MSCMSLEKPNGLGGMQKERQVTCKNVASFGCEEPTHFGNGNARFMIER